MQDAVRQDAALVQPGRKPGVRLLVRIAHHVISCGRLSTGRRLHGAIAVFCALTLCLLWAGVAGVVGNDRQHAVTAAVKENENLARAFEEHIVTTIGGLDQLTLLVKLEYEERGTKINLAALLNRLSIPKSVVNQLAVIDRHGYVTASSLPFTRTNLSDREHYGVHLAQDNGKLFISKPVLGRVSGKWSVQLTRRINKRDGSFGGVVVLSLDPYYFARFYRQVDMGGNGLVALIGLDGVVRARQVGSQFGLGQHITRGSLFTHLEKSDNGHYVSRGTIDGARRFTSYRRLRDYPFVVAVGTAESDVLADFEQRRAYLVTAALFVTALLLAVALWLIMLARRHAGYLAQLEDSRARQQAFMDSVPDSGWMKDNAGRFIAVNRAFAARFEVDQEAVIGKTKTDLFGEEGAAEWHREDEEVMRSGRTLRLEHTLEHGGETRWLETIKVPVYDRDGKLRGTTGVSRDITERKRTEAALVESERRLKLALDAAEVALFDWNIATGDVYISECWSVFLGGPPQLTHTSLSALSASVHPEDSASLRAQVIHALKPDVSRYRAQHRVRRNDGSWMWIESQGSVVARDADGRALRMLGINADITERKSIERALRASEERFRNLTELSSDWYWEQDDQFRFTRFSSGFGDRAGVRIEECLGKTRWGIASADVTGEPWAAHRAALERHEPFSEFEMRCTDSKGNARYWSSSGRPVFDASGRFTGYQGTGKDITRRKSAELAMVQAHAFLDSVIENIPDMIFVKDAAELRFVRINRAAEELLGYRREELIGKSDFDFFPSDQARFLVAADCRTLDAGELVDIAEERLETRSKDVRYLSTKKIPIRDELGRPRFLLGISQDITERKRAEQQMREMNNILAERAAQLAALNDELEAFSSSVSHDLRAPLRRIGGFIALLRGRLQDHPDPQVTRMFDRISVAAHRMSELIDDLLDFSRTARGELHKTRIDLNSLVAEVVGELQGDLGSRAVEWRIGALPQVCADRSLFRLALVNLIGNALKYSGKREVAVIEIGCAEHGTAHPAVYIRDNGVGFEMKHAHRLFGVFQRLHNASQFDGTGIGLANVKRIVDRHGGRVWAEAEPGKGATFYIALPAPEAAEGCMDAA